MKNIAIIPARSGSKGLPDKNIKELNGYPLIGYSIKAALESGMFDTVMVSTDSESYADIAIKCGATVPFLRDAENAGDKSSSWDVVREVLSKYKKIGCEFDSVCLLQPTSPLRTSQNIIEAYEMFESREAKAIVSVCEVEHSPLWCNALDETRSLNGFIKEEAKMPRQGLKKYYRINGAIYIAKIKEFLVNDDLYTENCYAYVMKRKASVDIDCLDDFKYAEWLLEN